MKYKAHTLEYDFLNAALMINERGSNEYAVILTE
jgi:hypothetical protein